MTKDSPANSAMSASDDYLLEASPPAFEAFDSNAVCILKLKSLCVSVLFGFIWNVFIALQVPSPSPFDRNALLESCLSLNHQFVIADPCVT